MKLKDIILTLIVIGVISVFLFIEPLKDWFMLYSGAKDWRYFFRSLSLSWQHESMDNLKGVYNKKVRLLPRSLGMGCNILSGFTFGFGL